MSTHDLLFELGCEELPGKTLHAIQNSFQQQFCTALDTAKYTYEQCSVFATPRRLAIQIHGLIENTGTQTVLKKGPAKQAAFDTEGKPTKSALGFARSCGVAVDQLEMQETDKGTWLVFEETVPNQTIAEILPEMIEKLLIELPVGKRMSLEHTKATFSRPIRWVVLLVDDQLIETTLLGVKTGRVTYGHRFHHPEALTITHAKHYNELLEQKGSVIPQFLKRQQAIQTDLTVIATQNQIEAMVPEDLLDEVTGLVEYPQVLLGQFNADFLKLPPEVLKTSIQNHQKCFTAVDATQKLSAQFFITSNIKSRDPQAVIRGNECVIDARLADAAFYYQADKTIPFAKYREGLKQIRFQADLGTLWDKSERLVKLSKTVSEQMHIGSESVEQAAALCKNDLLTQIVGEFPELQGIIGRHYALDNNASKTVALAIEEHYYPRFAQDKLPESPEGCALAITDRLDTLIGLFGTGNRPTGVKDPFSLRRQALALVRTLIEKNISLNLKLCLTTAKNLYPQPFAEQDCIQQVLEFCFERLRAWYHEQAIPMRTFAAVLAQNLSNPLDFHHRIMALNDFMHQPEAEILAAANKRVKNILTKNAADLPTDQRLSLDKLKEPAEIELATLLIQQQKNVDLLVSEQKYSEALTVLSTLAVPIDHFFDKTMIMTDDQLLKKARLTLLHHLRALFLKIADLSLL